MPRFWQHEDLLEFVNSIGSKKLRSTGSCVKYVKLLTGKKTGKSFGAAEVFVTDSSVAQTLCTLKFESGDYREPMTFEQVSEEDQARRAAKGEQAVTSHRRMLDSLDLDQYLMSPDVLYDAAKLHQRKLLTKSEPIEVDSFLDEQPRSREACDNERSGRGSSTNVLLPSPYVKS